MRKNPRLLRGDESINSGKLKPIQRWCIVRKYGITPDNQYVKIEIANATDQLIATISSNAEKYFKNSRSEDLDWWEDETAIIQKPLDAFKKELMERRAFPEIKSMDDLIVEEGMVFVYIVDSRMIHFTYQSRRASETIYNKLLGKANTNEASEDQRHRRIK